MERHDYDRVTTILAPFAGFSRISPAVLENAARRGSLAHIAIDCQINGVGCDIDDEIAGYMESFNQWRVDKKFLPNPKRFNDDKLMITGECDAIYESDKGLVLVDFKTSAKEGKTWRLQGSAYSYLAKQQGYDIAVIEFLQIKKDGKAPKSYFYEEDFESFLKLKEIYDEYFKTKQTQEELDYEYL